MIDGDPLPHSIDVVSHSLFSAGVVEISKSPAGFGLTNSSVPTMLKWNIEQLLAQPAAKRRFIDIMDHEVFKAMHLGHYNADRIVGVPDGMTAFTSSIADRIYVGQWVLKKAEVKAGTAKIYGDGTLDTCTKPRNVLVLEDVLTTGKSTADSVDVIRKNNHRVRDVAAFLARNKYVVEYLSDTAKVPVRAAYNSIDIGKSLVKQELLTEEQLSWIEADFNRPI